MDLETANKVMESLNNLVKKIDDFRFQKMTIKEFNRDGRAIDFDSGLAEAKIMISNEIERVESLVK